MILKNLDVRPRRDRRQQTAFNLAPRHVLGVKNSPLRMSALATQIQFLLPSAIRNFLLRKTHSKIDQLLDAGWAFFNDRAHHIFAAKPSARVQRVFHMRLE
jgi:hypothetical protein